MHQRKLKILTKITRQISPFLDPLNHLCLEGMGHAHSLLFADVSYHVPGNTATINTSDKKIIYSLTLHAIACMIASKPPSGASRLPEIFVRLTSSCSHRPHFVCHHSHGSSNRQSIIKKWLDLSITLPARNHAMLTSIINLARSKAHPSTSITPSLFHSQLKTYLFHKSYPR